MALIYRSSFLQRNVMKCMRLSVLHLLSVSYDKRLWSQSVLSVICTIICVVALSSSHQSLCSLTEIIIANLVKIGMLQLLIKQLTLSVINLRVCLPILLDYYIRTKITTLEHCYITLYYTCYITLHYNTVSSTFRNLQNFEYLTVFGINSIVV